MIAEANPFLSGTGPPTLSPSVPVFGASSLRFSNAVGVFTSNHFGEPSPYMSSDCSTDRIAAYQRPPGVAGWKRALFFRSFVEADWKMLAVRAANGPTEVV